MGNTQILLIVLGMVIIGITVTVALIIVRENSIEANRDAMADDLINIASRAQVYYNTPITLGGGGKTYIGLTADAAGMLKLVSPEMSNNSNGVYSIRTAGTSSQVILVAVGNVELSDGTYPTLSCVVRPGNASILTEN